MKKTEIADPFEEDRTARIKTALERDNTYVEATGLPKTYPLPEPMSGSLLPYTRVADLGDDLRLVPLDDLQGQDLVLHDFQKWDGELGEFMTLEASLLSDPSAGHFLTNCGGAIAMKKVESAFQKVKDGLAIGPLVARFSKIVTGSGRSFWQLS